MSRLRREDGLTITELLVTMSIGTVVLLALFQIVDVALPATNRVTDRVDTEQRGRQGLEEIVRDLRNATCVRTGTQPSGDAIYQTPLDTSTANTDATKVTFYPQLVSPANPGAFAPDKRQLELVGTTIVERTWAASGSPPAITWPTQTATRTLVQGVAPSAAVFTYWAYDMSGTLQPVTASADLSRVVKVTVQLQVNPTRAGAVQAGQSSTFQDDATFRVPTDLSTATTTYQGPKCTG